MIISRWPILVHKYCKLRMTTQNCYLVPLLSGADPGFVVVEGANPKDCAKPIYF